MSGRQRTLFQTWGSSLSRSSGAAACSPATERPPGPAPQERFPAAQEAADAAQLDSDDDVLLVAVTEAERQLSLENGNGFCTLAGAVWIYPTNCPVRDYQLNIARAALFCNTLVCLPTGLGKTFIAAVVMYNFYRWFPSGKVVFMAPTKPLVAQQIEACYRVMGIPHSHMAEMTGATQAVTRRDIWHSKRVLFLTPQVMVNDLSRGVCPAAEIKCLVIDEAHKALGNYAYCQVVRELVKYTHQFRILALSATPGSDVKAVQQVITNLLIGQIELRSEESPDILPYSHERRVEKVVVPLGEELAAIQKSYVQILEAFASSLIQRNVLMRRDIPNLTKYQLILARDQFRKNPSPNIVGIQQGIIEGEFAVCISLYHGYELLQQMGMRSLYLFLCGIMDGTKGMTRTKTELSRNEDFVTLYSHLEYMFAQTCSMSADGNSFFQKGEKDKKIFYSHPKLKKLEEVVVEHFKLWNAQRTSQKKCDETRVMIFSSFRDSVQEIAEMLMQHQPLVKVMTFVGHASGKSMKGFTQKEQLEVVKRFRSGGYNTLVSTCVGEEGLDIGEVDLIICFDAQKSPIRLVQRMGRTGRKRQGRIVVILAEGREERTYNQSQSNKRSIYKAISGNRQVLHFYQGSPRMVPDGINPQLHKMFITHGVYESEKSWSLQQKSSYRNGMRQNSKKGCLLSDEEFKLWDSRYRLKSSDEIKEITLPQVQFLSLQSEDDIPIEKPATGTRQLSLSEWRLWQDRPFPTYQVDHSDRCFHFISIMQMIERMRHEEEECSYELEMLSSLQMEDVSPICNAPRNEYNPRAKRISARHKKAPFTKNINQGSFFSETESNEKCSGDFRETCAKSTNVDPLKKRALRVLRDQPREADSEGVPHSLETDGNSVQNTSQATLLKDKRASGKNGVPALCAGSENVVQPCESLTECQLINKTTGNFSDSGYNSFGDGKSVSCSILFPLEEGLSPGRTNEPFAKCHSVTKEIVANVESFLSHSPPPLSELSSLECEVVSSSALDFLLTPCTENLENDKSTFFTTLNSRQDLELEPHKLTNHLSQNYGTTNKISDKPNFCDFYDKVHKDVHNKDLSNTRISTEPSKKDQAIDNGELPMLQTHQDESLILFEDVNTEFEDISLFPSNNEHKSLCVPEKAATNENGLVSNFLISDELLFDDNPELQNEIICTNNSYKSHEDLRAIHELKQRSDEYAFDCSKDLFSVTFDLGFCHTDSDDEKLEHMSDTNLNRCLDDKSGRSENIEKMGGAPQTSGLCNTSRILEQMGLEDCVDNSTRQTINAPSSEDRHSLTFALSAAKDKGCISPGYSQFSLPVREKVMSTPLSESNTLTLLSKKKKQMPKTPDSNMRRINPQSFKKSLNLTFDDLDLPVEKNKSEEKTNLHQSRHSAKGEQLANSESEDDTIFRRRNRKPKRNPLESPEGQKNSEVDSPLQAVKKHRAPLARLELSSSDEDENFQQCLHLEDFKLNRNAKRINRVQKKQSHLKLIARKFLDDEAELSEGEECVSSDENDESENEQDSSLLDFLNDETQPSQAVNDSEMRGIYMKSLRSPVMRNQYKMLHKKNNINIFSQIPEQDETYLEDSFCVHEEESSKSQSSEEECVDFNITEDFSEDGNKKYKTRHAVKLKEMKMRQNYTGSRKKLSRIILPDDSSEEENNVTDKQKINNKFNSSTVSSNEQQNNCVKLAPSAPSLQSKDHADSFVSQSPNQRQKTGFNLKHTVPGISNFKPQNLGKIEDALPFTTVNPQRDCTKGPVNLKSGHALEDSGTLKATISCSKPQLAGTYTSLKVIQDGHRACILVDSREITSGSEVISSLRANHDLHLEVCPLNGCDYIVSNRMVVERRYLSEMLNSVNKNKLIDQIQYLQNLFERICVIVEKDREKAGESSRMFKRTKNYDSLLTTLIGAGIRILFSSCQEETADLLKELCLVEQRKNAGIRIPPVVNSNKLEALQFYLSIPNISYITALNMCHQFSSVKKMTNSTPQEISLYAQVTHQKAEEIHRYIHYVFDMQMLPSSFNQGRLKSDM